AKQNDSQIEAEFLAALDRLFPQFEPGDVLACRVSRVRHVFALSTLNYSQRLPSMATSAPGLFIVNSAQIVNGTLNVTESVKLAESALDTICRPLEQRVSGNACSETYLQHRTGGDACATTDAQANRELVARLG